MKIAAQRLRELVHYDPATGIFQWRVSTNRRIVPGQVAGTRNHGRWQIKLEGRIYRAHRLAWLYVHGHWPEQEIDHKNGNPLDNRIDNLRDVSGKVNHQNRHGPQSRNRLGVLGVSRTSKSNTFRARIDNEYLGVFPTAEAAHEAYVQAKRLKHEGGML